jgi:hypothetical protein
MLRDLVIKTAQDVLALLQADTVFMSHIGVYTFTNGFTAPSLTVLGTNQQIPGIQEISGIEAVINLVPDTSSRALIAGCSIRQKVWTIYLVQHQDNNPGSLIDAADRLLDLAPGATYNSIGSTVDSSQISGEEQIIVRIPAHSPLAESA